MSPAEGKMQAVDHRPLLPSLVRAANNGPRVPSPRALLLDARKVSREPFSRGRAQSKREQTGPLPWSFAPPGSGPKATPTRDARSKGLRLDLLTVDRMFGIFAFAGVNEEPPPLWLAAVKLSAFSML